MAAMEGAAYLAISLLELVEGTEGRTHIHT